MQRIIARTVNGTVTIVVRASDARGTIIFESCAEQRGASGDTVQLEISSGYVVALLQESRSVDTFDGPFGGGNGTKVASVLCCLCK